MEKDREYSKPWKSGVCPKGIVYWLTLLLPHEWVDWRGGPTKEDAINGVEGYQSLACHTINSFYLTKSRAWRYKPPAPLKNPLDVNKEDK